jgi:hypothetical protein
MATDGLFVTQSATALAFYFINRDRTPRNDLKEKIVNLGPNEVLKINNVYIDLSPSLSFFSCV